MERNPAARTYLLGPDNQRCPPGPYHTSESQRQQLPEAPLRDGSIRHVVQFLTRCADRLSLLWITDTNVCYHLICHCSLFTVVGGSPVPDVSSSSSTWYVVGGATHVASANANRRCLALRTIQGDDDCWFYALYFRTMVVSFIHSTLELCMQWRDSIDKRKRGCWHRCVRYSLSEILSDSGLHLSQLTV